MAVLTLRVDPEVDQAIAYLTAQSGHTKSQVVRDAVLDTARQARREAIRQAALRVSQDQADLAEAQAILNFMGAGDAW